jgi:hypothetical protein
VQRDGCWHPVQHTGQPAGQLLQAPLLVQVGRELQVQVQGEIRGCQHHVQHLLPR